MSDVVSHYINGKVTPGTSGRRGDIYNPAIGEVVRQVDLATVEEVQAAVDHFRAGRPSRRFGARASCSA
jgi:malonate-semialdehyde dehydrogenase (acetylating)/methylmalonate-semialdehyde dehydrogenase